MTLGVTPPGRASAARDPGPSRAVREPVRRIQSRAVLLPRNDIDTDQIIPARFLKGVSRDGLGGQLFADWRYLGDGSTQVDFPLNDPDLGGREILVAGINFGCGSSREHAVWALQGAGFRAVIAGSFADIFRSNALKNGLLPIALDVDRLARLHAGLRGDPGLELAIDLERQTTTLPDGEASFTIDGFARRMLLDGTDELGYLLSLEPEIAAYEARQAPGISTLG